MPPGTTLQVPFTGGVNQATVPEFVDPNSALLFCTNGIWRQEGGIEKRLGVTPLGNAQLSGDPTMAAAQRLVLRGSELARIDGDSIFSFSPSSGIWSDRGLVSPCQATRQHVFTSAAGLCSFSVTEGNGYRAMAYRNTPGVGAKGDIFVTVYDLTSGATLWSNFQLTSGQASINPIAHIINGFLYVLYSQPAVNKIFGAVLNLTTMIWTTTGTTITAALAPAGFFDATPYVGSTGLLIAFAQVVSGITDPCFIRLESLPALTATAPVNLINFGTNESACSRIACRHAGDLNRIWFFWEVNDSVLGFFYQAACLTAAFGTVLVATTISLLGQNSGNAAAAIAVEALSATNAIFLFAGPSAAWVTAGSNYPSTTVYTTGAVFVTSQAYPMGQFVGRPFRVTDAANVTRCYVPFALFQPSGFVGSGTPVPTSSSYVLIDTRAYESTGAILPRIVATLAPRQGSYPYAVSALFFDNMLAWNTSIGLPLASKYRFPIIINPSEEFSADVPWVSGLPVFVDIATFDFSSPAVTWQPAEGGGETLIACGTPSYYDGVSAFEASFFHWPQLAAASINNAGGFLGNGQYSWAFAFVQVDSTGAIHRSAIQTVTLSTANAVSFAQFTVQNIAYTNRYAGNRTIAIEVYRTAVSQTTFYYSQTVLCSSANNNGTIAINDGSTVQDADATITGNATLYVTGGVLDSVCPPSLRSVVRHNERFWGIDDTGFVIWFTTAINGADAPWFNEGLTIEFEDGPLTALATLDDKLVAFSQSRIWILTGDGPAITGQGSDLSNPIVVMTDVAPADWRSVVTAPDGIYFQAASNKGIYRLGRDLQVQYVGKLVQDTAGPYVNPAPVVLGANLLPDANQIRFLIGGGSAIYYDYVLQRWGTLIYSPSLQCSIVRATDGQWYLGAADGYVYGENSPSLAAAWYDMNGGSITKVFVTTFIQGAWVKGQGLQSWLQLGHLQGFGQWMDPCDITVEVAFDYSLPAGSQSHTFTHATLFAANPNVAQWDLMIRATNSTCSSANVTLLDGAASDSTSVTGRGLKWLGYALDVALIGERNLNVPVGAKA